MSFFDPQNPGLGGLDELTDAETLVIQAIAALGDPGADRILFWDESENTYGYLTAGSGLTITGTTITATGTVDGSGTTNEIVYWVDSNTLGALAVATYPSLAELAHVKGLTSAAQTQINTKQATITFGTGVQTALGINVGSAGAPVLFDGALGTPSSGTLTNATGLPIAGLVASTSTAIGVGSIELGHATDTTLSRVSAGVVAIEGVNILTTSTGLPLAGGTMTGNITLGENTSLDLDPAGSADGKYTGICITGTAGAALAFGEVIYLSSVDSRWELADADSVTTADRMLGMCVLAAAADGNATKILLVGQIRADAKFPALTIGSAVYVGETAGAIQVAIPTGADNVIRRVGYALTADEIYFNPSMDSQTTVA